MRAEAIIGAGFGDEGKGYWTDVRTAQAQAQGLDPWVVRFNSGAQAGHTVCTPDGRRHVFHHVGSGSFLGAGTFLGSGFALNPLLLFRELAELAALGVPAPRLAVDPRAPVTLPYDIMINQAAERARGAGRHGSCGVGFNETVERSLRPEWALRAVDLAFPDRVRRCLETVRADQVPARLRTLGLPEDAIDAWRWNDAIIDRFVDDAQAMSRRLRIEEPTFLQSQDALVFEGAQGLRLDQDLGDFPFVTRSHTGLPALLDLALEAGLDEVNVTYGTRAYLTRHGAGPLPDELDAPSAPGFADATNVPNPFQGTLRFALLDPQALGTFIGQDLARGAHRGVTVTHDLSVNCLDQMGPTTALRGGEAVATDRLAAHLREVVGARQMHQAWGPTRADARVAPKAAVSRRLRPS